ncbi:MAG: PH domain-containing protein [Paramuribaculum sp.]|nr:PH domain-containing protein [Paramuribaculum sp.]
MTSKVKFSTFSIFITIVYIVTIVAFIILKLEKGHEITSYILSAILIISCFTAYFYAPVKIKATDTQLEICRSLSSKSIHYKDIAKIFLNQPTLAEKRLFASGGFFGYWGWFSESTVGKYFAYYGKASDCFIVVLKSGKAYRLGCENAPEMVQYITERIK